MKKLISLLIIGITFAIITTPKAEAQIYVPGVVPVSPVAYQNAFTYRPVVLNGVVTYVRVPVQPTPCATRAAVPTRTVVRYHRGTPYNYVVPANPGRVIYPSQGYSRFSPRYSGYVTPGVTIRIVR